MTYTLIIAEKPSAAKKIANFLATTKVDIVKTGKVSYYKFKRNDKDIVVVAAAGHLYSLAEDKKNKTFDYPVYNIKWYPLYEINKEMKHTKQFLDVIKKLAKNASDFIIACDYDIEGEVIGYNILRFACGQTNAKRMKFSTLTKQEIVSSFENAMATIDYGQANAGIARHTIDWFYGINLSRALMSSIKKAGLFKIMSIGRVQGPTLKLIVDREEEIKNFKPEKYWQIYVLGNINGYEIKAQHIKKRFDDKKKALLIYNKIKNINGYIKDVKRTRKEIKAPFPFDLTTLQTEAYSVYKFSPKKTLDLAQQLYLSSYISYPRTSSQKLPNSINFRKIIQSLLSFKEYQSFCNNLLTKTILKPNNGKKEDPAHPAIYPTGVIPKDLSGDLKKLYDLIVRRFLATFYDPMIRESLNVKIDINKEMFVYNAVRTVNKGWYEIYPFVKLEESIDINVKENDVFINKKADLLEKETKPPKRYTQSSLVREMEKLNLGTKATRAQIIDTLYKRGYIIGDPIKATDFGITTIKVLEKYSPKIIDLKLTSNLEKDLDEIRSNKKEPEQIIESSKHFLDAVLEDFKKKENNIGNELKTSFRATEKKISSFGRCPKCKEGNLVLRESKFGKFLACDKYPKCDFTLSIPKSAVKVEPTSKICEYCGYPLVKVKYKKRKTKIECINPNCPSKQKSEDEEKKLMIQASKKVCPKCGAPLVLRKGPHGYFFGCSNYPKCSYVEKIR